MRGRSIFRRGPGSDDRFALSPTSGSRGPGRVRAGGGRLPDTLKGHGYRRSPARKTSPQTFRKRQAFCVYFVPRNKTKSGFTREELC